MKFKRIIPHIFLAVGVALMLALAPGCVTTGQPQKTIESPSVRFKMIGATDYTLEWMVDQLMKIEKDGIKQIRLDITSGGGSIPGMWKLIDMLESLKAKGIHIHTHASGMIASAAVPIYLAGTYRTMSPTCYWMVHPHSGSEAVCDDINSSYCEMLEDWTVMYARYVADRTLFSFNEMMKLLEGSTDTDCHFFNAEDALTWNVAHEITYG